MTNFVIKPSALSFHGYGYWDNTVTDKWIFDGDNTEPAAQCCGGVIDLLNGVKNIRTSYPNLPVWLTEVNVNADWGNDANKRPWNELAIAWWATMFQQIAPQGAGIIHQYDVADGPQFGLFDDSANKTYIAYYVFQLLNQAFPQGSTLLSSSSSQTNVLSLAARKPDGNISVMIINRQLASNTVKSGCGVGGVTAIVTVNLPGITPTSATLQQLDKNNITCSTGAAIASTSQTVDISQPINIDLPGYGIAVLNISTNGQSSPTPTANPSPSQNPSPSPAKPGDIDGNNKVDIFDYNILLTNFGKTGGGLQGDLDGNNKVDIFDYNILLTNFGK